MSWLRLHDEVADDPKVQRLAPVLFKTWINLLCLASRHEGKLPGTEDIAFTLRISIPETQERIDKLTAAGLFERNGTFLVPHNWDGRQYKSDNSTERVRRYRQRKGNVSETPPEQRQSRAETEQREDAQALPPISLAQKVAAELRLRGPGIVPAIGGAIEALVREGKTHNSAVEFLIAHGKDAQDRGETVNRFWFDDSKWLRKPKPTGRERPEISAEGRGEEWDPGELAKAQEEYRRKPKDERI